MEQSTEIVPVQITKDKVVQVQVTIPEGEADIGIREDILATFGELTGAIEEISRAIASSIEKVRPQKASVQFGLSFSVQEGKLTALLVQGGGTASIAITLEWGAA